MNHTDISEICAGLILQNRLSVNCVNPDDFEAPYDTVARMARDGKAITDIMDAVNVQTIHSVMAAADTIPRGDTDLSKYTVLLESISLRTEIGRKLERMSRSLIKGDAIDVAQAENYLSRLERGTKTFTTMDQVTAATEHYIPSFFPPIDDHVGGWAHFGLNIVGAPPGTGKTTLMARLIANTIKAKPWTGLPNDGHKKCAFLSLEMTKEDVKARMHEVDPELTDEDYKYLIISDEVFDFDDAYTEVAKLKAAHPDLYFVGIDFADLMVPDDQQEGTEVAGQIYKTLAKLAKKLVMPIVLLAQLSRSYIGGIPHVNHIRWSGLAEAMAVNIYLLYNPNAVYVNQGEGRRQPELRAYEGKAYLIVGKARFGTKMDGIGAIMLDWNGETGWGQHGDWFPLAYA